jgi:hypothetical protein
MVLGSAAARFNDEAIGFTVGASSAASATSAINPLDLLRQYMRELELGTKESGWDTERGAPVHSLAWSRARVFLENCFESIGRFAMPDVSASGDGYVHLVWHLDGRRAIVEVGDERAHWTVLSQQAPIIEEGIELRDAMDKLRPFLRGA